jgi:hypothetical protein
MIRNEDGLLTGYVFVDVADRAAADYVQEKSKRELVRMTPVDLHLSLRLLHTSSALR